MLARIHLVRHGEVDNPDDLVYADLPGFVLSELGHRQAGAVAAHLATAGVAAVVSSPLERAVQTAQAIASTAHLTATTDDRLTEWRLSSRWAGVAWDDLPTAFPGELEAYLSSPHDLDFAPESLSAVAERMAAVVDDLGRTLPGATAVIVSHMDPVQALRLHLLGRPLSDLLIDPPRHASATTLDWLENTWHEVSRWQPEPTL